MLPVSPRLRDRFHRTARWFPSRRTGDGWTRPCLLLAGIDITAGLSPDGTELSISVGLDTAHRALLNDDPERTVPLRIVVEGTTVFRC
ncbi:hypothetical protein [Streptomyces sp. MI02-7b]|uniref:hypothetical protein n=1 Tax=Streptomyces sp. MI02-7b TaxID=462941 RepID=UPI0029B7F027|nr:hypothetical protein [Streptomyces sp. MI02-7b]MDX3075916.1 hypothetical protein [Streptomyces sp. MI02-7b]